MVTHDSDLAKRVYRAVIVSDGEIIDEYLSKTFPSLGEDNLKEITRKLVPEKYLPGALIIQQGQMPDKFFIITHGEAEVFVQEPGGTEIVLARMRSGQYFGEIALLRGGHRTASVRAALDTPVDVVSLDTASFNNLVGASLAAKDDLTRTAEKRLEELGGQD
jgi:CRP-like cAMP-binding protein